MILFLLVSTLTVMSSAADKKPEDKFTISVSKTLSHETDHAAGNLAASWTKNKYTDQKSVDAFLEQISEQVLAAVKNDVISVVKSSLGEAVKVPEQSDMYRTLNNVIRGQAKELTLGKAKLLKSNDAVKVTTGKDEDIKATNIYENLFENIQKKNVTEEEKETIFNETKKNINALVKRSMNWANKTKDTVASRSGNFFYNNHFQQQQEQHSSKLAQQLTHHVMTDMIHNPVRNPCNNPCHNHCNNPCHNHCNNPYHNSGLKIHGENTFQESQRHHLTSHHTGSSALCGGSGLVGDGFTGSNLGGRLINTFENGHGDHYGGNSYSGANFNSLQDSSMSRVSGVNSVSHSGTSGSGVKGHYSGLANLWSLGDNTKDSTGSSFGRYGSNGLGGSSLYGTNSLGTGHSSLFNSGSSLNSMSNYNQYGNIRHGSNFGNAPRGILGTGRGIVQGTVGGAIDLGKGIVDTVGNSVKTVVDVGTGVAHGVADVVGTIFGGGRRRGSHFSASNSHSSSSSQSESSKNHVSYSNSNNMW